MVAVHISVGQLTMAATVGTPASGPSLSGAGDSKATTNPAPSQYNADSDADVRESILQLNTTRVYVLLDARLPLPRQSDVWAGLRTLVTAWHDAGLCTAAPVGIATDKVAWVACRQDRLDFALPLYQAALALLAVAPGAVTPEYAEALNNLGAVYSGLKQRDKCLAAFLDALCIRRTTLGNAHPDVAESLCNVASELRTQSRYSDAVAASREALHIQRTTLGR